MSSESIQKIFEDGQAKLAAKYTTEELGKVIPSYLNNSAGLYKHRSKSIPTLPASAAQIKLEEKHKFYRLIRVVTQDIFSLIIEKII